MSARDDYPTEPEPGGFYFALDMHGAMCDEIDRLRADCDDLLAALRRVMAERDALRARVAELQVWEISASPSTRSRPQQRRTLPPPT